MNEKICPLLSIGGRDIVFCQGAKCAWWDLLPGACCMASAADYTHAVSDALDLMTDTIGAR